MNCNIIVGIRGLPLCWFRSYLSERKQYVSVNDVNSDFRDITHSVPQGSNLGPLLYLIFINDLPNCTNFFDFLMFDDDCTITRSLPKYDLAECSGEINSNLKLLENWLKANKIKINADKTKYILFSYRGKSNLTNQSPSEARLFRRLMKLNF